MFARGHLSLVTEFVSSSGLPAKRLFTGRPSSPTIKTTLYARTSEVEQNSDRTTYHQATSESLEFCTVLSSGLDRANVEMPLT